MLTAAGWFNRLGKLGVALPLSIIFDIGWLLVTPRQALQLRIPTGAAPFPELAKSYASLLSHMADSPVVCSIAGLRLHDELIAVLLARLLSRLTTRYHDSAAAHLDRAVPVCELPLDPNLYSAPYSGAAPSFAVEFLRFLVDPKSQLHLLSAIELIDVNLLRLLSADGSAKNQSFAPAWQPSSAARDSAALEELAGLEDWADLVELIGVFDAPDVRDVVHFSMELLPAILETRPSPHSKQYPVGGYATLIRRGSLDNVLLGELCHDEDLFALRHFENELLYYGREQHFEPGRAEHCILIDGSASMCGRRQVFARGLAIAFFKKLRLLGAAVSIRFFDGRLHEPVPAQAKLSAVLPYLLSYHALRGRNYGRVFQELLLELQSKPLAPPPVLHILTHSECHIPRRTVQALTQLAELNGVFLLPSCGDALALDYLPLLHHHVAITDDVLWHHEQRKTRALDIVENMK